MRKRAEYMREYRKRFTENQRIREALRSAYRRYKKKHPEMNKKPLKPEPIKTLRCLANGCKRMDAKTYMLSGCRVYLCDDHKSVNIFA